MSSYLTRYQTDAIDFVNNNSRSCLVMPTGSGKTRVALVSLLHFLRADQEKNACFIGPKTAKNVMMNEYKNIQEQVRDFGISTEELSNRLEAMSYETFKNRSTKEGDLATLTQKYNYIQNRMLILDEAHALKNPVTHNFKAVVQICGAAPKLVMLTATPVTHSYLDYFTLRFLLALRMEEKFTRGRKKYDFSICVEQENLFHTKKSIMQFIKDVKKSSNSERDYRGSLYFDKLPKPFFVVDRKTVYPDLPDKLYSDVVIQENNLAYKKNIPNNIDIHQSETLRSQNTDDFSRKFYAVMEQIAESYRDKKRVLVYLPMVYLTERQTVSLDVIKNMLHSRYNIPLNDIIVFESSLRPTILTHTLEKLNNEDKNKPRVVLAGKLLAESVTLKCFDQVIFFGPEQTFSNLMQVIGRTIRKSSHLDCNPAKLRKDVKAFVFQNEMDKNRYSNMQKNKKILEACIKDMQQRPANLTPYTLLPLRNIEDLQLEDVVDFLSL